MSYVVQQTEHRRTQTFPATCVKRDVILHLLSVCHTLAQHNEHRLTKAFPARCFMRQKRHEKRPTNYESYLAQHNEHRLPQRFPAIACVYV